MQRFLQLPRIGFAASPGQFLFLLVMVLACSPESRPSAANPDTTEASASLDTVRVTLRLPGQVQAGDSVPITVRVENTGSRRVDLSLLGREIAFDIIIETNSGQPVWRRLQGATLQSILQVRSLAPGEAFELHDSWPAARPGDYLVSASLPTDAPPLVTRHPTPLRVVPRA